MFLCDGGSHQTEFLNKNTGTFNQVVDSIYAAKLQLLRLQGLALTNPKPKP